MNNKYAWAALTLTFILIGTATYMCYDLHKMHQNANQRIIKIIHLQQELEERYTYLNKTITEENITLSEPLTMMMALKWLGYYNHNGYYCVRTKGRNQDEILNTSGKLTGIQKTEIHEYAHAIINENQQMKQHFCGEQ